MAYPAANNRHATGPPSRKQSTRDRRCSASSVGLDAPLTGHTFFEMKRIRRNPHQSRELLPKCTGTTQLRFCTTSAKHADAHSFWCWRDQRFFQLHGFLSNGLLLGSCGMAWSSSSLVVALARVPTILALRFLPQKSQSGRSICKAQALHALSAPGEDLQAM